MQLGGIEREHTHSSHQVTNCMHEHTNYQKTGAAHAAASGMTEKLEQNRQEQLEMQASPLNWLEKLFQKGRQLGRQIWGSSDVAGKAENAALTEGSREAAQTGVVASADAATYYYFLRTGTLAGTQYLERGRSGKNYSHGSQRT